MKIEELREELKPDIIKINRKDIFDCHEASLMHKLKLYVIEVREYNALPLKGWFKIIEWWKTQEQPHMWFEPSCWTKATALTTLSRWYLNIDAVGSCCDFISNHAWAVPIIAEGGKLRYGVSEPWTIWEEGHAHEHPLYSYKCGILIF